MVSLLSALTAAAGPDRRTFVRMDDRAGRAAVIAFGAANIDLTGTAAYLRVLADGSGNALAANAWMTIREVALQRLDSGVEGDPTCVWHESGLSCI